MVRDETKVVINPGRVRDGGDPIITVSAGLDAKSLCLSFNQDAVDDFVKAAVGTTEGLAWFIDAASARDLVAAMQEHL